MFLFLTESNTGIAMLPRTADTPFGGELAESNEFVNNVRTV